MKSLNKYLEIKNEKVAPIVDAKEIIITAFITLNIIPESSPRKKANGKDNEVIMIYMKKYKISKIYGFFSLNNFSCSKLRLIASITIDPRSPI
jgi:hypothetical protein